MKHDYAAYVHRAADADLDAETRRLAFSELVRRFQNMAYACALGMLGDPMTAKDAVQETFLSAWRHLHRLKNPAAFPAWLRRRVIWQCYHYERDDRKMTSFPDELIAQMPDDSDPEETAGRGDLNRKIRRLIKALPRNARESLTLYYLEEYTQTEIAAFLDLSEGTVRKRLHDARNRLKGPLEKLLSEATLARVPSRKRAVRPIIKQQEMSMETYTKRDPADVIAGIIKPAWCEHTDGGRLAWTLFCAAVRNDTDTLTQHLAEDLQCARLKFWYTYPIEFAVREGHLEATRILWSVYHPPFPVRLIELARDHGHDAVADYLADEIGAKADTDLRLHEAIEAEDFSEARRLLDLCPDLVHGRNPDGVTPLHLAVLKRQTGLTDHILAAGAPVDAADHDGYRPIHRLYFGRSDRDETTIKLENILLKAGAEDSITLAAARGDRDKVERYLAEDPERANDGDTCEIRPVSAATEGGYRDLVKLLLDHGADPNLPEGWQSPYGRSLVAAAMRDDVETARLLLEAGADPNGEIDSSGWPALWAKSDAMRGVMYAYGGKPNSASIYIQQGNLEAVASILAYNPDPFAQDDGEDSPYTAIASGYNGTLRNGKDTTAMEAILNLFLHRKYPMPESLTYCQTYLYRFQTPPGTPDGIAEKMTRRLLENGLNPSLPDWLRRTPLHYLGLYAESDPLPDSDDIRAADLLLEFGADINAVDEADRTTPLGIAAKRGFTGFAAYLLDKGADPNATGAPQARPLAWAARRGYEDLADLLRRRGAAL